MNVKRFGTFEGVFTPTVLSILGVVMYLRLGWVVGQVGLGEALFIILLSNLITLCTGLSVASITTNMRIGAGGAYAIISRSLGFEAGGAIGVPLYLSQAISIAFYIAGFSECWRTIFPGHEAWMVSLSVWASLLLVSYVSAKIAFRLQFLIMAVIGLSLVAIFLSFPHHAATPMPLPTAQQVGFWKVFAIFFPAVTGILAGVNMSGELKDPQRSIPWGTLSAILVTFMIYVVLSVWYARAASAQDLVRNTSIIVDLSRFKLLTIAGIMGATLSSALSMFVASPRILQALAKQRIVPFSSSLERVSRHGEPTSAILLTAFLALIAIALGSLNSIAVILTMFFLITYGALNVSVFIEKVTGIVSFRPAFRIPLLFSLTGAAGCFYAMFIIDQVFSWIAILVIGGIYVLLVRRKPRQGWPDVRQGLCVFVAEQAIKVARGLPYHPKIWKPNLFVPMGEPKDLLGIVEFVQAVAYPRGRVDLVKVVSPRDIAGHPSMKQKEQEAMDEASAPLREEGLLVSSSIVEARDVAEGLLVSMQALQGQFLTPNTVLLRLGLTDEKDDLVKAITGRAAAYGLGLMILRFHPKLGFGQRRVINLWIKRGSPNFDLAILVSLQLRENWEAQLRLLSIVPDDAQRAEFLDYFERLKKIARLPSDLEAQGIVGDCDAVFKEAPPADLNIFGMPAVVDIGWMRRQSDTINTSILFLRDSGKEDAIV